jgi:PAS domain S-box-containing protein
MYNAIARMVVVLLAFSLTFIMWKQERIRVEREAEIEFEFQVSEATEALRARMLNAEQILRGLAGAFSITDKITRDDWRECVRRLQVTRFNSDLVAFGYAPIVSSERLKEFVERVRKSDHPGYAVRSMERRPQLAPMLFIEPLTPRNMSALGLDIYSNPNRFAALEIARDTGEPSLAAHIEAARKTGDDSLDITMFMAVYRRGSSALTVEERRKALAGFVSGGMRIGELLDDLFAASTGLDLRIYDGSPEPAKLPLAQIHPRAETRSSSPRFTAEKRFDLGNRLWTLQFASTAEFESRIDSGRSPMVLVGSLLTGVLLIALIWSLSKTRDRAVKLARQMTLELRESRDALISSEERLNLAMHGSSLAIFDWNLVTGAVELSEQWSIALGDSAQPIVTSIEDLLRLVHPDDLPHLMQELEGVMCGRSGSYHAEHRVKNHHGEWVWISSRAKVVQRNADGLALRVTGTNADITQQKQIEKMKDEFIGTVSHELRTPLTAIIGALGLLSADDAPEGASARMLLDMAYRNSERLAALINDVLDIEKLEAGMMEMQLVPTPLGPFLQSAVELNRSYADQFNVHYVLREPLPVVSVQVDPERLMQVVTNLLSNAAKFSPSGAPVTIAAEIQGNSVRISVTDIGPGIPNAFRDRVFQKFAQSDASSTRRQGGTGLGLWICQAIIAKLDGRIGFESEPGKGATFYLELPVVMA